MELDNSKRGRYILDTLYGIVRFPDYIWEILFVPEIQRLRELRLYNINSLYFTGGANINRYEHSLGTCYLALQCVEANLKSIPLKEKKLIVLAALLHDLYNAAFGHSLEYVIEHFSPEDLFSYKASNKEYSLFKYKQAEFEPIYFGMAEEIPAKLRNNLRLSESDIDTIGQYINGKGEYGALISGSIDLDNIDNIYRMSYHMGLTQDTRTPLQLAKSMWCQEGELYFRKSAVPLIKKWRSLRKQLYKYLLLNPDEFSAKYMLTEAIELSGKGKGKPYSWHETDFQLLEKLSKYSAETKSIISRLMKGTLYGCFGIYKTTKIDKIEEFTHFSLRSDIESDINELIAPAIIEQIPAFTAQEQKVIKGIKGIYYYSKPSSLKLTYEAKKKILDQLASNELKRHKKQINRMFKQVQSKLSKFGLKQAILGIHTISDVNKTERKVKFNVPKDGVITIGRSSKCFYIGVFIKNIGFANFNPSNDNILRDKYTQNIKKAIKDYLANYLQDPDIEDLELYSEVGNG